MEITTDEYSTAANGINIQHSVKANSTNYNTYTGRNVSYVVIHYTGNKKDTALANARYFSDRNRRASAHFFVDDSAIYQSVGLKNAAWHCGARSYKHATCRNSNSIAIEMCTSGSYWVSVRTQDNAAALAANLLKMLGYTADAVDTHLLRHYDVTGKKCPAQMASDNNAEWNAFRNKVKTLMGGTVVYLVKRVQVKTYLNVRTGPGIRYGLLSEWPRLNNGNLVDLVGTSGSWSKIRIAGKYFGWVSSKYLA